MTVTRIETHRQTTTARHTGCTHTTQCPAADAPDHDAARVVASYPEQGWSLLCNGVVVFEDTGEILPNRTCVAPHRPATHQLRAA